MAGMHVIDPRPQKGSVFLLIGVTDLDPWILAITKCAGKVGRRIRMDLDFEPYSRYSLKEARAALHLECGPTVRHAAGFRELKSAEPTLVIDPVRYPQFLGDLEGIRAGGWDFCRRFDYLDPIPWPQPASITVTYL